MKKEEVNKLLLESGLIIFSVLFALFIDRLAENHKTEQQKNVALERIRNELTSNLALVKAVLPVHEQILRKLTQAVSTPDDTFRLQLLRKGYLDFSLLAEGHSIYPRLPTNSSWEAAQATGIMAELDYRTVEACTEV